VARGIFSIIPHGARVEARFSLQRDMISWRQSESTGETLREEVVVRQFARANDTILEGNYTAFNTAETKNNLELNKEAEER